MASPLSFRLCRRLALCLALAALLATLAAPLQASPLDRAAPTQPLAGLIEWVQGLLVVLGVRAEEEQDEADGPSAAFLPDGQCMEPNGTPVPCSKNSTTQGLPESALATAKPEGGYRMR